MGHIFNVIVTISLLESDLTALVGSVEKLASCGNGKD